MKNFSSAAAGSCFSLIGSVAPFGLWTLRHLGIVPAAALVLIAIFGFLAVMIDWSRRYWRQLLALPERTVWFMTCAVTFSVIVVGEVYWFIVKQMSPALGADPTHLAWFYLVAVLFVLPVLEEIVFRSWLLGDFWSRGSLWVRIAISIFGFSLLHLWFVPDDVQHNMLQLWRYFYFLLFASAFTYIWLRYRSLCACIFAHWVSNCASLLIQAAK